ncbi:hypothetical protein BO94DRAFT_622251 [Aspergillus sclerotioniger CBS 115572]|uniref:Uncharacterized protein n=1 Tax=Aspergillus sclerotioniger CBS 115572 TaxID=1450535 RepID=A0A317X3B3_9EURO|nr:hypothetical protein BO94DRAFT_622251 [Aspergillus sclerotioniger CBS 115572]PWY93053.1 hypothetical protein BO94DRAFT_622251 [Aspergillus sclerotioniger CBS 115572]
MVDLINSHNRSEYGSNHNVARIQPQLSGQPRPSLYRRLLRKSTKLLNIRQHGQQLNTGIVPPGPVEAPIEHVATRNRFKPQGFLTPGRRAKIPAIFSLDTGAGVSTMRRSIYEQLHLPLESFSGHLRPVQSRSDKNTIKPYGIVRQVSWHFAQRARTYTADFYVIDDDEFDVIIGRPEIEKYALLQPSADIGPFVVRDLS